MSNETLNTLGIKSKQQKNIRALIDYLSKLPTTYEQFDMGSFYTNEVYVSESKLPCELKKIKETVHTCGTVGCAIGHAPFASGTIKPRPRESWSDYSFRFLFGNDVDQYNSTMEQDKVWEWCFGGEWSNYDNTPQGAAKRMKVLLETPMTVLTYWDYTEMSVNDIDLYKDVLL